MKSIKEFNKTFGSIRELEDSTQVGRQLFHLHPELKRLHGSIDAVPASLGTYLGELREKMFTPSLALLDLTAMQSERKAFINDIGEKSFLFGKDVHKANVTKLNATSGLVLVQDSKDRNLGLGEVTPLGDIKLVLDRGDFLRREMD